MYVTNFIYRALPDAGVRDRLKIPSLWGSSILKLLEIIIYLLKKRQNSFDGWYVFPLMLYIKLLLLMH